MKDEKILRTMSVSKSMALTLDLEVVVGTRFKVMRGQQELYTTDSVNGVHGFLVGWSVGRDDVKAKIT